MDTDQLRETLEGAGLTQYEASAYIALIELGTGSATDIAETADVPQARIYDILRGLEQSGYIETYQQDTLRARAHSLDTVLEELQGYAENVMDATEEIRDRWERPTVEDHMVSVVKRFETILDRARKRIRAADNEIEAALTPSHVAALRDALETAYDNGVVIKLALTTKSVRDEPSMVPDEFSGIATEVRYRNLPTPFLVLTDRTRVCFAPERTVHPTNEYGVLVDDYSLSRVFDWHFQTAFWDYWEILYIDRRDDFPRVYTNIRECIRDIAPLSDDDRQVIMTVEGVERASGEEQTLTGVVTDCTYTGDPDDDTPLLASFVEPATLLLDTDEGTYEIGGWGALLENFEVRRLIIEDVN